MKRILVILLSLALGATLAIAQNQTKPLTNSDVMQMVKSGFDEQMIVKVITANEANFDTSMEALVKLREAGVSQNIVGAMLDAKAGRKALAEASAGKADNIVVKEGTEVKLKFAEYLSSKTAALDDPVTLLLTEDLKVGDITIATQGAKALATVSHVKKAGMLGKGGELNIRLEHLAVGDSRVRLRGTKGKTGQDKLGTAVVLTVLFGPIGLIKHGKNIEIKEGTPLVAFVDQDVTFPNRK